MARTWQRTQLVTAARTCQSDGPEIGGSRTLRHQDWLQSGSQNLAASAQIRFKGLLPSGRRPSAGCPAAAGCPRTAAPVLARRPAPMPRLLQTSQQNNSTTTSNAAAAPDRRAMQEASALWHQPVSTDHRARHCCMRQGCTETLTWMTRDRTDRSHKSPSASARASGKLSRQWKHLEVGGALKSAGRGANGGGAG